MPNFTAAASSRKKREFLCDCCKRKNEGRMFKELQLNMALVFSHRKIEEKTDAAVNELLSNNFALEGNEEEIQGLQQCRRAKN